MFEIRYKNLKLKVVILWNTLSKNNRESIKNMMPIDDMNKRKLSWI